MTYITLALLSLRAVVKIIVIILFIAMITCVLTEVAGRYFFNFSIAGATELARFLQVWLIFLGSGIAMHRGQHVAINFIPRFLPSHLTRFVNIIIMLSVWWFLALLAKGSLPLIRLGMSETSAVLGIKMWIVYLSIPVSSIYIGLEAGLLTLRHWNNSYDNSSSKR